MSSPRSQIETILSVLRALIIAKSMQTAIFKDSIAIAARTIAPVSSVLGVVSPIE
jgi:hypothetical protein